MPNALRPQFVFSFGSLQAFEVRHHDGASQHWNLKQLGHAFLTKGHLFALVVSYAGPANQNLRSDLQRRQLISANAVSDLLNASLRQVLKFAVKSLALMPAAIDGNVEIDGPGIRARPF